jgi:hypothetical protein
VQELRNCRCDALAAAHDDDHADAAVEDAMHFALGHDAALALQPVEQLRSRPGRLHDLGLDRGRQDARHVAGQTAAGDVRQALDRQRPHQREQRFDVDSRRREERIGERGFAVEGLCEIRLARGR